MADPNVLKEPTQEQKMFNEVIELLCLDGWQKITREIDNCYVFVMDSSGEIKHRYLEWDSEYSEWHGTSFWYPGFWFYGRRNIFEDVDDYGNELVICTSVPSRTENTLKAMKILEEYHESFGLDSV